MSEEASKQVAGWLSLLVVGISLNTLGLINRTGAIRWVLMGAGCLLLVVSFIGLVKSQKK